MPPVPPELLAHREWLGQIQQVGLVVSPSALVKQGVFVNRHLAAEKQARLRELLEGSIDLVTLGREILDWPDTLLAGAAGGPGLPDTLTVSLPEHADSLSPTYAIPDSATGWQALACVVAHDTDLDRAPAEATGWRVSPHARCERLLRETGVNIGLLFNGTSLRLLYAPRGESSGHLTFRLQHLAETLGRPMVGALCALLSAERLTDVLPDAQRLPALLRESRKYQNDVSTKLAGQVLQALWELLRGFQRADDDSKGELLREALRENPRDVYGGLLSTLMRLVFILYAEDRGLMPAGAVYQRHYSVSGLFERLREDQARYPDTMDARYGAWAHLLSLFRLIHDGGGHGGLQFPARHGRLFNPDSYPFLEGRRVGSARQKGEVLEAPRVPDGVVFRILQNLLMLDGERLSYRALDVEQIGSVYEAMMGFALEQAHGPSIGCGPKHIVINLEELLEQKTKDRAAWLREKAEEKLTSDALARATTVEELISALGNRVSPHTPSPLKVGAMYLQPTEERRRSGSHYTPRSLTEPIVRTTLRPIFERLGDQATPGQILDLKICDPAMGSGAFLVEACRLLGERLMRAWEVHKQTPKLADDEDAVTHAKRLVAERCLYGVDKNVFAVDLAKLSLWLATLAREHPFTFLDHALRHGDSLVGLSRDQIACFNWEQDKQMPLLRPLVDARVQEAQRLREQIQAIAASNDVPEKSRLLKEANEALDDVRAIGNLAVSAFFERKSDRDRQTLRAASAARVEQWLSERGGSIDPPADFNRPTFHWEIEFPEVFTRSNAGFDAFIGNPPFAGKNTISAANGANYLQWLLQLHIDSHGNADLVAHFFRRAFNLVRRGGAFGLIATNTIAQGDTRGTGLRWIRHHGGTIFAARKRITWPGEAAVVVSVVHVYMGKLIGPYELNGREVDLITAFLFHAGGDDDPRPLLCNAAKSFQGSIVLGMGFTFDDTEKKGVANPISLLKELTRRDIRNAERVFPFIGYAEVADNPTQQPHRYVIDFFDMTLTEASRWPDLLAIVREKVLPERASQSRKALRERWWQYAEKRPGLYRAIANLRRVLVAGSQASAHFAFEFLPKGIVYSSNLSVIAADSYAAFAALQSRVHEIWTRMFMSTLEDRLAYTPTTCFETFPFVREWESNQSLEAAGRQYHDFRSDLMIRNNEGLTKTYNRFNDPSETSVDIARLRELHDSMDRAVIDAYGWADIRPTCDFFLDHEDDEEADAVGGRTRRRKPWRFRWPDNTRDEILGRLLQLNTERANDERISSRSVIQRSPGGRRRERTTRATPSFLD